jgi:hypothetical protein
LFVINLFSDVRKSNILNDSFELPSLEEIEEMERQQAQAIDALEISDHSVNCQKCGTAVPLLTRTTTQKKHRITVLENQIGWLQEHHDYIHRLRIGGNNNNNNDGDGQQQ